MNHALVRLIASDLDGTFLRDDRTVSGRTTGAVRAARASGVMVIAATGRQAQQLPAEVAASGIRHVVASNGAIGFDLVEQRVLFQDLLAPAAIAALVTSGASAVAKASLDAALQDDLPEESRASAFGRTESTLQLAWVLGGALGVLVYTDLWVGFTAITALLIPGLAQTILSFHGGR